MHPVPAETARSFSNLSILDRPVMTSASNSLQNECQKSRIFNYQYENGGIFWLWLKTKGCSSGDTPQLADYQRKYEILFPM
jgi:hypothetical protein